MKCTMKSVSMGVRKRNKARGRASALRERSSRKREVRVKSGRPADYLRTRPAGSGINSPAQSILIVWKDCSKGGWLDPLSIRGLSDKEAHATRRVCGIGFLKLSNNLLSWYERSWLSKR